MSLVVDASVVIKWFVEEVLTEEADRVLQADDALFAPSLLVVEITNIAWKKALRGEIESEQAHLIASSIHQGPLELIPDLLLHQRALALGFEIEHSIYDCLYLALAERLDCPLVTADARLVRKLEPTSHSGRLVHVSQW